MSKKDNLVDFLTDLANGIRTVEGSTAPINPQEFRSRVEALSTGGGESGVPIKVATLPTPTEQDLGKVYLNTTDGSHYVCELRGGSLTIGGTLGDKLYFDTSVNPNQYINGQNYVLGCVDASNNIFALQAIGGNGVYLIAAVAGNNLVGLIYADGTAITVEEFNQGMGVSITAFGWQMSELDTSAFADYVIQLDNLASYGNLAYFTQVPAFEKANEVQFEGTIANLQNEKAVLENEKDTLQSEKDTLQEQYDEANNWMVLFGNNVQELYMPDGTTLREGIFTNRTNLANLTKISFPSIDFPFYKCLGEYTTAVPSSLTDVEIRGGVICAKAFQYGESLRNLTIGDGVTKISEYAFSGCTNLANVTIGNNVTRIDTFAFSGCGFTNIEIPNSVTYFGLGAFQNARLTSIVIPNSIKTLSSQLFNKCTSLISAIIPDSVTNILQHSFGECYALTKVTIKATTPPKLDNLAFDSCCRIWGKTLIENNNVHNPDGLKDGYIYVPLASVESYRSATNWAELATQIMPYVATIEELANIDGTTYDKACVGEDYVEYTYNGTSWEVYTR